MILRYQFLVLNKDHNCNYTNDSTKTSFCNHGVAAVPSFVFCKKLYRERLHSKLKCMI